MSSKPVVINPISGNTNRIQTEVSTHYRITDIDNLTLKTNVLVMREGDDLVLHYADGTVVILEDFYTACVDDSTSCQVALPHHQDSADDNGEYVVTPATSGTALSDGSIFIYVQAHDQGALQALLTLAAGNGELEDILNQQLAGDVMMSAETTTAETTTAETTTGGDDQGGIGSGTLLGALGVLGAIGGVAAAGGGGSSSGATTPAGGDGGGDTPTPVGFTVSGAVTAGPVIAGDGLTVTVYAADGTELGTTKVNDDGTYTVTITRAYAGLILIKVIDTNPAADYRDEATKADKDLTSDLRVIVEAPAAGATKTANINPLTELATRKVGLAGGDNGASATSITDITPEAVTDAQAAVAKSFGITGDDDTADADDLVSSPVKLTVDKDGKPTTGDDAANEYGKALAAVSGVEEGESKTTGEALDELKDEITEEGLSPDAAKRLEDGATSASTDVELTVDDTPPTISAVTISNPASGTAFVVNEVITITVTFSEDVIVTGTPTIDILIGTNTRTARYTGGTTATDTLTFQYTVQDGENDADGISIAENSLNLNGGTITDTAGNDANRDHDAVAAATDKAVDTTTTADEITTTVEITGAADNVGSNAADVLASPTDLDTGNTTNDTTPTLSGTISAPLATNEVVQVYNNGVLLGTATVDGQNWTYTQTPALGHGATASYRIQVVNTDTNTFGVPATFTLTIDTRAPSAPGLALADDTNIADGITSDPTMTVRNIEAGATWEYSTDSGTNWNPGTDTTFELTNPSYEAGDIQVRQTDAAGNRSRVGTTTKITIDTEALPPGITFIDTGTNTSDNISNNPTITVTGLEAGATWEYTINGNDGTPDWRAGTGTTFSLGTDDGTYSANAIRVRQTDVAGNQSTAGNNANPITIDTEALPPGITFIDTGTNTSDRITNNPTITVTGLEAGATWEYTINGNDGTPDWKKGVGNTFELGTNITYNADDIQVRQTDAAGNVSRAGTTTAITIDTEALPPGITFTDTGTVGDNRTNNRTVTVTDLEAGATWEYSINNDSWQDGTGTSFNLGTAEGTYNANAIRVRQTDVAGNISEVGSNDAQIIYDTTAPSVTGIAINTPRAGNTFNTGEPIEITLTFNEAVTVVGVPHIFINIGGTNKQADYESGNGTTQLVFSYSPVVGDSDNNGISITTRNIVLPVGATIKDTAGNDATLAHTTVGPDLTKQVDAQLPRLNTTVTIDAAEDNVGSKIDDLANNGVTDDTTPTLSGTITAALNANEVIRIYNGATLLHTIDAATLGASMAWTYTPSALPDGATPSFRAQVVAVDGDGNVIAASATSVPFILTIDTTSPTAPAFALTPGTITINDGITNNPTINVAGIEAGATWEYSIDGGGNWRPGMGNSFNLADGTYAVGRIQVRQTDVAGNVSLVNSNDDTGRNEGEIRIKTTRPTIDNIAITPNANPNGSYVTGDNIIITVTFNEAISIIGRAPTISIDIGGTPKQIRYVGVLSSPTTLVFRYTVVDEDTDVDGISIDANAITGNITDIAGNPAILTHVAVVDSNAHRVHSFIGDAGANTYTATAGHEHFDGQGGTDTVSYTNSDAGVTVDLSDNNNNANGWAKGDVLTNIENLIGSDHNDELTGDKQANVLTGGMGDDVLEGGAGADRFVFAPGHGVDVIADFTNGNNIIDLSAIVGLTNFAAVQAVTEDDGNGNTVITTRLGNTITLTGVLEGALTDDDFIYAPIPPTLALQTPYSILNNAALTTGVVLGAKATAGDDVVLQAPVARGNITDDTALESPESITTVVIGGIPYALVAAHDSNGVQILNISDPDNPMPTATITDDKGGYTALKGAYSITTVVIDDPTGVPRTYALVAAEGEDRVQIIDISNPAMPKPTAAITDDNQDEDSPYTALGGGRAITTVKISDATYALVAAYDDDGVQIIDITDPNKPKPTAAISDGEGGYTALLGATAITTVVVGGKTYALVAAYDDDGVQIIDISDPDDPTPTAAITDDGDKTALDGAIAITTVKIAGKTYALVTANNDDGVQIIDISDPHNPTPTTAIYDEQNGFVLDGVYGITTIVIAGKTYALGTTYGSDDDGGVQIIDISDPENPIAVTAITDDGDNTALHGAEDITTTVIDGRAYALVSAYGDDGVQVIELPLTATISTITITATGLDTDGNEQLAYGTGTVLAIGGAANDDARDVTIAGITGLNIVWDNTANTITVTKTDNSELTTIEVEAILATLRYDNTDPKTANNGVREFSIVLTDADGLDSTPTVHRVNFNSGAIIGDDTDEIFQGVQITANADIIDGKGGVDTVSYAGALAGVTVNLGDNTQNARGWAVGDILLNIENIDGSTHADTLTGDANANELAGNGGGDTLNGEGGDDTLIGDAGVDILNGGAGNDTLYGGAGGDTLDGGDDIDTASYAVAAATGMAYTVLAADSGLAADVAITGVYVNLTKADAQTTNATNTVVTDARGDTLSSIENLIGSIHDDVLIGDAGVNRLDGGAGDDHLMGGGDADTLNGDAGDDTLYGGTGDDTLYGGDGIDTLNGGDGDDVLFGDAGDDTLNGGDGNDWLIGGADNDTFIGGAGNDTLIGGAGTDTASYENATEVAPYIVAADAVNRLATAVAGVTGVYVNLNKVGTAQTLGNTDATDDRLIDIENLIGSAHNDVLIGDRDVNRLDGADGNDTLYGGAGDDTLISGAEDDTLTGGAGDDTLTGGADDDTFVFAAGHGADTITDFTTGNNKIDLSAIPGFTNLKAVQDATVDDGNGNTVITTSKGNTIKLEGILKGALTDDHFIYAERSDPSSLALKTTYSILDDAALTAGVALGAKATAGDDVALQALVARGNIENNGGDIKLSNPESITTVVIGGIPYALVTSWIFDEVQILNISKPAMPTPTASISDDDDDETAVALVSPYAITTVKIGVSTYALVAADGDDGVQIIDISNPNKPKPTVAITDGATFTALDGAQGITTVNIGDATYALVAAYWDDGVQIIDISDPAMPTATAAIVDNNKDADSPYTTLNGATAITTVVVGGKTYALVAAYGDNGVQIINITTPAAPSHVAAITDSTADANTPYTALDGAIAITTVVIADKTYALVAAYWDDGVQIIDISNPHKPTPTAAIVDDNQDANSPFTALNGARAITTVMIAGKTYALVAAYVDDGVQIIDISDPKKPTPAGTITNADANTLLDGAEDITTTVIDGRAYALVSAYNDDSVQVIELPLFPTISTITITATGLDNSNEQLVYGSNAMGVDLTLAIGGNDASLSDVTIAGITGIDIAWVDADDTITVTKTDNSELTTIEVEAILAALRYDNTNVADATDRVREFSIVLTDLDGNPSTAVVHSVNFNSGATIGDDAGLSYAATANADLIDGKGGVDTVSYDQSDAGVTVDLSDNTQNAKGWAADDVLLNIENLIGSAQADTLTGDANANRLEGGAGIDTLTGGAGADRFVLDTNALAADTDIITDFNTGQNDRIQIDTVTGLENTLAALNLAVADNGDHANIVSADDHTLVYMTIQNIDHTLISDATFTDYFSVI